jgi:hypothetical protein
MMKVSVVKGKKSELHRDIIVKYQQLNIDRVVDSWFFDDYLDEDKRHLSQPEILEVYISCCFIRIMELKIGEAFNFYYDFSDQYSEGIRVQRESTDNFSIHRIITGWGALNPHSIDGNQTLDYKLQGTAVSEDRTEFLLGLLRSVEGLLIG